MTINHGLLKACEEGNISDIIGYLLLGADINCFYGQLLAIASNRNDIETAKILIQHDIKFTRLTECLEICIVNKNIELVSLICSFINEIESSDPFLLCLYNENVEIANIILTKMSLETLDFFNDWIDPLLNIVISSGKADFFVILINKGVDTSCIDSSHFILCIQNDYPEMLIELFNIAPEMFDKRKILRYLSLESTSDEIGCILVRHIKNDPKCFQYAIKYGEIKVVEELIEKKVKLPQDKVLYFNLVVKNQDSMIGTLLNYDSTVFDADECYDMACRQKRPDIAQLFLEVKTIDLKKAASIAFIYKYLNIIKCLKNKNVPVNENSLIKISV
jgi:hypothetical protein